MYLTKREKALEDAQHQGENDFSDNKFNDEKYKDDGAMRAAYVRGWKIAESDYYRFHGMGF